MRIGGVPAPGRLVDTCQLRGIDQARQHALAGQQVVEHFDPAGVFRHHLLVEGFVQQQLRIQVDLKSRPHRRAQYPAQRRGSDRQLCGLEGGRAGQHAETLAHQIQGRVAAGVVAPGDLA